MSFPAKRRIMEQLVLDTPIGKVSFLTNDQFIHQVDLYTEEADSQPVDQLTETIAQQVSDYFSGTRQSFDLPIKVSGSEFRQKVWHALTKIPYGKTLTYGQLASQLSSSARAIGGACRHIPTPLIVPCHRIVAAQGIGGFSGAVEGARVNTKQWLLNWESRTLELCN